MMVMVMMTVYVCVCVCVCVTIWYMAQFSVPKDRFARLEANGAPWEMITMVQSISVSRKNALVVNADVSTMGLMRVELLQVTLRGSTPVKGFTLDDCDGIVGDSIGHVVRWRGRRRLPEMKRDEWKVRIVAEGGGAMVYSFIVVEI
eukprot:TRINITY_DN3619_c0_g1_i2.p2 TRINITY_DN3619_c0_g1~~TRINITY_DN3619_c0_g1_i2.p2  ORF type:complete len:146 (+),score=16.81 TRINITY_DN3619_c0_g1_i2:668-1105(+)